MRMRAMNLLAGAVAMTAMALPATTPADPAKAKPDVLDGKQTGLVAKNLLSATLERVPGTEVVVSHITVPANTTLPRHWHPGEEFVYVLEGTAVLWQEGKPDTSLKAGDVYRIPLKKVHTAITGKEGATVLVFRVHEEGKPVRVLVD